MFSTKLLAAASPLLSLIAVASAVDFNSALKTNVAMYYVSLTNSYFLKTATQTYEAGVTFLSPVKQACQHRGSQNHYHNQRTPSYFCRALVQMKTCLAVLSISVRSPIVPMLSH